MWGWPSFTDTVKHWSNWLWSSVWLQTDSNNGYFSMTAVTPRIWFFISLYWFYSDRYHSSKSSSKLLVINSSVFPLTVRLIGQGGVNALTFVACFFVIHPVSYFFQESLPILITSRMSLSIVPPCNMYLQHTNSTHANGNARTTSWD